MCNSAEVSFISSGALTFVGILTKRKNELKSLSMLTSIPFFFAFQQFAEGVIWTCVGDPLTQSCTDVFTQVFVFIGEVFWPIWIPLSVHQLETNPERKKILKIFVVLGFVIGLFLLFQMLNHEVSVTAVNDHLKYAFNFTADYIGYLNFLYLVPCVLTFFVASRRDVNFLGGLYLLGFIVTKIFYKGFVFSMWCFVAAIVSVFILKIALSSRILLKEE